jgi:hypothetical protein
MEGGAENTGRCRFRTAILPFWQLAGRSSVKDFAHSTDDLAIGRAIEGGRVERRWRVEIPVTLALLVTVCAGVPACNRGGAGAKSTAAAGPATATTGPVAGKDATLLGTCTRRDQQRVLYCKEYRFDPADGAHAHLGMEAMRKLMAGACTAGHEMMAKAGADAQWAKARHCERKRSVGECIKRGETTVWYATSDLRKSYIGALSSCKLLAGDWRRTPGLAIDVDDASVDAKAVVDEGLRKATKQVSPSDLKAMVKAATTGTLQGACLHTYRGAPVECEASSRMPEMMRDSQRTVCQALNDTKDVKDSKSTWIESGRCPSGQTLGRCKHEVAGMFDQTTVYYAAYAGPYSGEKPGEAKRKLEKRTCGEILKGTWSGQ